jgi:arsenite methyltransferase
MTTSFTHDSSELARIYDRVSDVQFEGGKRLVERLEVQRGGRVLDIGCGTGRLARWIAERVGSTGGVVGIDPLPDRIALARSNAGGIRFEVGQAEELGAFEAGSFDAVCMSAVFHWVEDKPKALREVRRVLRPGGRLGLTTPSRELLGASTISSVMASVLAQAWYAKHVDLSKLALASRGQTTTELVVLMLENGLDLNELHVMQRRRTHPTGGDAVDFLESSAFGNFLRIVPEEFRPNLREDLTAAFEARKVAGEVVIRDWGTLLVASNPAP